MLNVNILNTDSKKKKTVEMYVGNYSSKWIEIVSYQISFHTDTPI
jgi:hypothetical protein